MIVQAGGARLLLQSDPDRARDSILNIERTGREALADLRRLLGMLRKNDDPRALAPQPGLSQLPSLINSTRNEGVRYELQTLGAPIDLTPGVDLVAYRVIEMALLTAVKHGVSCGRVSVRFVPHELEVEISGDKPIPDIEQDLRSVARRVDLYEGSLQSTIGPGGGFELQARLPIREATPA